MKHNCILECYYGLVGAGKTTIAAGLAKRYIKHGYPVYSNVPIKGCYQIDLQKDLGHYDISNCLLIIDEAGSEYSNRSFKTNFDKDAMRWIRLFRHAGVHIVVFSQSWDDSDITFRRLACKFHYVRRSLLPFFVDDIPILCRFGINENTKEPCTEYRIQHPLIRLFTTRRWFAPRYWKMFNSWDMPPLPVKKYSIY